jgi:signal transduction histidine kinase
MKFPLLNKTQWLATASLLIVFTIDTFSSSKYVVDVLYLCCILIVFKQSMATIYSFGIAACLLIVLNTIFEHRSQHELSIIVNRCISVFAILITAYIAISYNKLSNKAQAKEQQYLKALERMLVMTSHKVRQPLARLLGLVEMINMDGSELTVAELKERCQYLHLSANELDELVRELNQFIQQAENQQSRV